MLFDCFSVQLISLNIPKPLINHHLSPHDVSRFVFRHVSDFVGHNLDRILVTKCSWRQGCEAKDQLARSPARRLLCCTFHGSFKWRISGAWSRNMLAHFVAQCSSDDNRWLPLCLQNAFDLPYWNAINVIYMPCQQVDFPCSFSFPTATTSDLWAVARLTTQSRPTSPGSRPTSLVERDLIANKWMQLFLIWCLEWWIHHNFKCEVIYTHVMGGLPAVK